MGNERINVRYIFENYGGEECAQLHDKPRKHKDYNIYPNTDRIDLKIKGKIYPSHELAIANNKEIYAVYDDGKKFLRLGTII